VNQYIISAEAIRDREQILDYLAIGAIAFFPTLYNGDRTLSTHLQPFAKTTLISVRLIHTVQVG
jgi:hypothetical protein